MSRQVIDRRDFLTLPLVFILLPLARAHATAVAHTAPYRVDVSLLYGALTYRIDETLSESIDKTGGRYAVAVTGEGEGIANRIDSAGILRQGRWAPLRTQSFFSVKGRESRSPSTSGSIWRHASRSGDSISRASRRGRSRVSPRRSRSASTGGPST